MPRDMSKHHVELSCKVMTYYLCFQNEIEKTGNQFLFILYRKLDLKGQFSQEQKFFHHALEHTKKIFWRMLGPNSFDYHWIKYNK